MSGTPFDSRHLSTELLLRHWSIGAPMVLPIRGEPQLRLELDPRRERISLRIPVARADEAPVAELANVSVELVQEGGQRFLEVATDDERLLTDAHAMLVAIADRVQLDGIAPAEAVRRTLASWRAILALRTRMSEANEIGLFGELSLLDALLVSGGSLASWHGPLGEEHDFALNDCDVEVKSTSTEQRRHRIGTLTQLEQTDATPLWLVSLQLTRGGTGVGRTLPQLVDSVVAAADDGSEQLDRRLAAAGWAEADRRLYMQRWRPRTPPLALHVVDDVPRLVRDSVRKEVDLTRIVSVEYMIDVTGLTSSRPLPASLAATLDRMGTGA